MKKDNEKISFILYKINKIEDEIEKIKKPKYLYNADTGELTRLDKEKQNNYISKDKLKADKKHYEEIMKSLIFVKGTDCIAYENAKALVEYIKKLLGE